MPLPKYIVRLTAEERAQLEELIHTGKRTAAVLVHAQTLLKADAGAGGPGWDDGRIAEAGRERLQPYETVEKDHGRIEIRCYVLSEQIEWLPQKREWAGLQAVGRVESTRLVGVRPCRNAAIICAHIIPWRALPTRYGVNGASKMATLGFRRAVR